MIHAAGNVVEAGADSPFFQMDLLIHRRDSLQVGVHQNISEENVCFTTISQMWDAGLRNLFQVLTDPPWKFDG
jgi:predicted proteasome-type protease